MNKENKIGISVAFHDIKTKIFCTNLLLAMKNRSFMTNNRNYSNKILLSMGGEGGIFKESSIINYFHLKGQ